MGKPSLRAAPGGVFGSALVAAAIALLIAFIVRSLFGLATPAELFGDRITQLIPLSLFSTLLVTFGTNAKHLYFAGLLAGEGILTALTGLLYWRARAYVRWLAEREPTLADVPLLALLLWLLSAGLLAPLIGGGWFGAALVGGAPAVLFSEVVPSGIFALVFVLLLRQPAELAETADADTVVFDDDL
nr:hypothetical protein [Ktedonobacterales bacterium]